MKAKFGSEIFLLFVDERKPEMKFRKLFGDQEMETVLGAFKQLLDLNLKNFHSSDFFFLER